MLLPDHGANPHYLYHSFDIFQPENVTDFSTNVNPFGPPESIQRLWPEWFSVIQDYPDPHATLLTRKLAMQNGVSENWLLLGNGGAEIIHLIGRMLATKRVLIIHPAFSEYESACRAYGCKISYYTLLEGNWKFTSEDIIDCLDQMDAVFLCTPNNPTGIVYEDVAVLQLIQACAKKQILVIIDEAFYDFYLEGEQASFARYCADYPNLIIIRSMTKMYAIAGLRLGYAIAHPTMIKKFSVYQPHWSVNRIALLAGELCVGESDFVMKTVEWLAHERNRLFRFFKKNQFTVSNSKVNYYLLRDDCIADQQPLLYFLLEKGIVPRHTKNFPGLEGRWLRFAVKRTHENDLLLEALIKWRRQV